MKYFDRAFWRMTTGFLLLIVMGLATMYLISHFDRKSSTNGLVRSFEASQP